MEHIFFQTIGWNTIPQTEHAGERMRMVEYSKNYRADHWCLKGHLVYCLEGEMISELYDGREFKLSALMSYQVGGN